MDGFHLFLNQPDLRSKIMLRLKALKRWGFGLRNKNFRVTGLRPSPLPLLLLGPCLIDTQISSRCPSCTEYTTLLNFQLLHAFFPCASARTPSSLLESPITSCQAYRSDFEFGFHGNIRCINFFFSFYCKIFKALTKSGIVIQTVMVHTIASLGLLCLIT